MGAIFNEKRFSKWEDETHIPQEVMSMLSFICQKIGIEEVEEETITIRNRGGWTIGYAKGFTMSYCTSSLEDGPSVDYSGVLLKFIKGLGFQIENSYGDNGLDSATNWHDTYWNYDFIYKPSEVYEEYFLDWDDKEE